MAAAVWSLRRPLRPRPRPRTAVPTVAESRARHEHARSSVQDDVRQRRAVRALTRAVQGSEEGEDDMAA